MGGGLSQKTTGKLLKDCKTCQDVEEVLAAYCYAKSRSANNFQVLRKLQLLTLYLRAIDESQILQTHYQAFTIIAHVVKFAPTTLGNFIPSPSSSSSSSSSSTSTSSSNGKSQSPGSKAWSIIFDSLKKDDRSFLTRVLSRRNTSIATTTARSGSSSSAEENEEPPIFSPTSEGNEIRTRPTFSRHTSAMSGLGSGGGESGEEESRERLRLQAGRGANEGLGRGLLSSPPLYDGGLVDYMETLPSAPLGRAPGWENEELPGWSPREISWMPGRRSLAND